MIAEVHGRVPASERKRGDSREEKAFGGGKWAIFYLIGLRGRVK